MQTFSARQVKTALQRKLEMAPKPKAVEPVGLPSRRSAIRWSPQADQLADLRDQLRDFDDDAYVFVCHALEMVLKGKDAAAQSWLRMALRRMRSVAA